MADRFPLIVNETSRRIEEIVSGDNLELTGNGIIISGDLGSGKYLKSNGTTVFWDSPGNVYLDQAQTITNKTIESSFISGTTNTFTNIPNSALDNNGITINGNLISLGGSATTPNDNTTYSISAVDGVTNQKIIRLTDSGSVTDDVSIAVEAYTGNLPADHKVANLYIDRSGDQITLSASAEDKDTITRLAASGGILQSGDITFTAGAFTTVQQSGATITISGENDNTITRITESVSGGGSLVSGDVFFTSGSTNLTIAQTGNTFEFDSVDTISRLRATGSNGGSYFSGDFDLIPGTNVDLVQSNNTVTINSSFTNTVTSLKEDAAGTFQTGNVVFLGAGATTVTQGTDGNGDTTFTISSINSDTGATLNASGGLILQGNNFRLRNYNNLSDSTVMKWDNSNDQLTDSIITDDGSTVTVDGDLIVTGATSTIESQTVVIADSQIELRKGSNLTGTDAGIQINRTTDSGGTVTSFNSLLWTENGGYWRSYDGSVSRRFVTEDEAQILTNKTLTSPTLTDPQLGAATASTLNGLIVSQTVNATLSVAANKTFTCSNTLTLTGTDTASVNFNQGGTVAYRADNLSVFGNTTSSQLRGMITDETGAGSLVFNTSPSITSSIVTGSNSFDVFNTTATTINAFGAATTVNIGDSTGTTTFPGNVEVDGNTTLGNQNGDTITVNGVLNSENNDITIRGTSINPMRVGRGNNAIASNTAMGYNALNSNTTGSQNTGVGFEALTTVNSGFGNTAFGHKALNVVGIGDYNTSVGRDSTLNLTSGNNNTAVGVGSLSENTSGNNNVCIGYFAGFNCLGSGNVIIGAAPAETSADATYQPPSITGDKQLVIGSGDGLWIRGDNNFDVTIPKNFNVGQNLTVSGNLVINGTTTSINSNTIEVDDKTLTLAAVATIPSVTGTVSNNNLTITGVTPMTGIIEGMSVVSNTDGIVITGTIDSISGNSITMVNGSTVTGSGAADMTITGPSDTSADGGGLIVKGATDKQITWTDATDAWTLTEHLDIPSAKEYRVGNVLVAKNGEIGPASGTWQLNAGVTTSSLTSVGTLTALNVGGNVTVESSTAPNLLLKVTNTQTTNTNKAFTINNNDTTSGLDISYRGEIVPKADADVNLGGPSNRWANIYSADLQLSNEGAANEVDGTWGQYTIQEGEEDLFLINRRSGKKYKFVLQEVG